MTKSLAPFCILSTYSCVTMKYKLLMMKTRGILAWLAALVAAPAAEVSEAAAAPEAEAYPEVLLPVAEPPPKCSLASRSIRFVISCLSRVKRGRIIS